MTLSSDRVYRSRRTVVISGGSRGIGLACARRLAASGQVVRATYHETDPPVIAGVEWCKANLSEGTVNGQLANWLEDADCLVANAGILRTGFAERMRPDDLDLMWRMNVAATSAMVGMVVPGMRRRRWGRIVFVSSAAAMVGSAGSVGYAATKSALVGMARSITREVASRGVTCNVVCPGLIDTEMTAQVAPWIIGSRSESVPARRNGTPEEVAALVAFLVGEDSGYVNGALIPIDGGLSMGM